MTWWPRSGPPDLNGWARAALLERRTVSLNGDLDEEAATQLAAELMLLDAAGDGPVLLLVNSAGGSLDAALSLIDVIDLLGVPVHASCTGRAHGPALAVLSVPAHRVAGPHASLRCVEPPSTAEGKATDLAAWAEVRAGALDQVCTRMAAATKRPAEEVRTWWDERRYLTADQAMEKGLIDEVATPVAEVRTLPRQIGFKLR